MFTKELLTKKLTQLLQRWQPAQVSTTSREDAIDLLRALAIIVVVLYHFTARFPDNYYIWDYSGPQFNFGKLGVQLFFIVSGYCIYLTLGHSPSFSDFMFKRLARIWPAFVVAATLTFVVVELATLPGRESSIYTYLANITFLNIFTERNVDGAYWSLLVEIKFYALLGLLYFSRKTGLARSWFLLTLSGYVLSKLSLLTLLGINPSPDLLVTAKFVSAKVLIFPHAIWFLIGIVLYDWKRLSSLGRLIFLSPVVAYLLDNPGREAMYLLLLSVLAMIVIPLQGVKIPAVLRWVGLISYPLYLIHQNVGLVVIRGLAPLDPYLRLGVATLIVLAIATLINLTIELNYKKFVYLKLKQLQVVVENPSAALQRLQISALVRAAKPNKQLASQSPRFELLHSEELNAKMIARS